MQVHTTRSAYQTKVFAGKIVRNILGYPRQGARVLALKGDLGSGKTTFVQGVAAFLGVKEYITSPTFVLMKRYGNFYHFDCYRVRGAEDIAALGWQDIVSEPQNLVLVEWADKIKRILPKETIWIYFKTISPREREIRVIM